MTAQEIDSLLDRHLSGWLGSSDGPTLRSRMADAIREVIKVRDQQWADGNATLRHERDELKKKQPINTHVRLFDLVRQQRAELHEQDLITDDEYAWLCSHDPLNSKKPGSPSVMRLEDYDQLRAWKDSALAVERSWDCQAVGKLLGIPLGSDIRSQIEPAIRALIARLP